MRVKLIVIIAFVALAPLVVSALMALRVHQRAFERALAELEQKTAESGALRTRDFLDEAARGFRLLAGSTVRWRELSEEERAGALWLVYRQHADVAAVVLVDREGRALAPAAWRGAATAEVDAHPLVPAALAEELARAPLPRDRPGELERGAVLASSAGPILPMAVTLDGGEPWTVVTGLSLANLCAELAASQTGSTEVALLDAQHRGVCAPVDERLRQAAASGQRQLGYHDSAGRALQAAIAPLPGGWSVVAQQPTAVAFAPSRTMRRQTIFWIALSLVIALAAGAFLAQGITRPVAQLAHGADEVARGRFSYRLPDAGADELGRLAQAFNRMCVEIEKRDAEIRAWNQDLLDRVNERTRELKEAQSQLLRSQKIAAVSSLGAGMAHEINNPLTGVLGFTQVLLKRARGDGDAARGDILEQIEKEAHRIREVVSVLLGFSESYAGEHSTELEAAVLLDDALKLMAGQLAGTQIEVVRDYQPELPTVLGNRAQVQEALVELLKNAITALGGRGRLSVSTAALDGQLVKIAVTDDGKGIAPEHLGKIFDPFFTTKDDRTGQGLGLTVVHRVVEEHHGTVKATSAPGQGTTFTITLPAARRGSHLA